MRRKKSSCLNKAPLSLYKRTRDSILLSGQIGLDADGKLVPGGAGPETRQILTNLQELLLENFGHNVDLRNAVKLVVYIVDGNDYHAMNDVYKTFWLSNGYPARTCVVIKELWSGACVMIDGEISLD
jgi:2-iminobutanoate/2-iminopropanoate deaminase